MVKDEDRTLSMPVGATYKFGLGAQWQVRPTIALVFCYEFVYVVICLYRKIEGPWRDRSAANSRT